MIDLHNATSQPITLTSGHQIPGNGRISVSPATMTRIEADPYGARMLASGRIVARRPVPEEQPVTRATIAAATRGELLDILEAHGIERGDVAGRNVEDSAEKGEGLRSLAARAVFADL